MPPTLGLTVYQPDKTDHGYTLFAPMTGTSAYLIDMQGRVVHHWSLPYRPGAYGYLLDNGHLLVAGRTGKSPVPFGGAGGTLLELDWAGNRYLPTWCRTSKAASQAQSTRAYLVRLPPGDHPGSSRRLGMACRLELRNQTGVEVF